MPRSLDKQFAILIVKTMRENYERRISYFHCQTQNFITSNFFFFFFFLPYSRSYLRRIQTS